ncbi:hypothetical protein M1116_03580 [Patescibacteria group bacterium]|nr:hypothetical protein [Patescibacteria group bacterium]
MVWHEIKHHPFSFTLLFIGLILFLLLFFYFYFDPHLQRRVIYGAGVFYFLWSLLHHYQKGDLQFSLVIEYLVVALFGALLLTGTLF